jgi:hypothetical protein
MKTEFIAAISGALAGGVIFAIFELIKWHFGRAALVKALKIGLFFEISDNRITEIKPEKDETPNFSLALFHNSFYQQNKTDIARLFDELLLTKLSKFYLMISAAYTSEKDLLKILARRKEATFQSPLSPSPGQFAELRQLNEQIQGLKDVLRVTLCPALALQEDLLSELKSTFKVDPDETQFIRALKKHELWWEKQTKEYEK